MSRKKMRNRVDLVLLISSSPRHRVRIILAGGRGGDHN